MLKNIEPANFPIRIEGDCQSLDLFPMVARISEKMSVIPTLETHFFSENGKLALAEIVGKTMHLVVDSDAGDTQKWFRGTCVSAEVVCGLDVGAYYKAEVRPWLWYLTRRTDLRIFQNLKVIDIIQKVLEEYAFSGNLQNDLTGTYQKREYCVQYRETDFDFISRLMEEEGIYYYFDHSSGTEKMVLADSPGCHQPVDSPSELEYSAIRVKSTMEMVDPLVFEWNGQEQIRSGKVTLEDYDFENSTAKLKSESKITAGDYTREADNRYDYPGHYRTASLGEDRAKIRMEADAIRHHIVDGLSDAVHLCVGKTLTVTKLERTTEPDEGLLIACEHDLVQMGALDNTLTGNDGDLLRLAGIEEGREDNHLVRFNVVDASKQYRAPLVTKWPNIGGIHTAIVTGPPGEEIHTDKYGQIKIQFHWDLDGKKDDKTTCWVRTMMPWTGKNWGAIAVPRIGQEVVIQFEEGDPDRPLCIGMLYNDKTMPPYKLPDNKTQSGVKTNSSMGGGGFNELMFEDKKGDELVRFQSEKDYLQIVKNDATIEIGLEKKDSGDLTQTIHNDFTETVKEGDHSTTLNKGDHNTLLKQGNMDVKVSQGKITVEAMQSIEFKVGPSTIKMTPQSIDIKSPMITVKAEMKADVTSPMTTVNGDMMLTLTGGMVMIN